MREHAVRSGNLMQWPIVLVQFAAAAVSVACNPVQGASQSDTAAAAAHQPPDLLGTPPSQPMDIEEFVKRSYFEGVPFAEASRFDSSVLPKLKAMLSEPEAAAHWSTIVGVVGVIGGPEASSILIGFLDSLKGRAIAPDAFRAGMSAVVALGYVRKGGEPQAVTYLETILREARNNTPTANGGELRIDPGITAASAVQALALSGQPDAERLLTEIARDAKWAADLGAVDALQTLREVRDQGLAEYLASAPS